MNNRLEDFFLSLHNFIHEKQIGFTKNGGTTVHSFLVKNLIDKYCSSRGRLYACFIDFHKAFDSDVHIGLKLKLLHCNVGSKFYKIINNLYKRN